MVSRMYDDKMVSKCADCDRITKSDHTAASTATLVPTNAPEKVFRALNDLDNTIDTMHEEVNHRPTAQQWAVSTP